MCLERVAVARPPPPGDRARRVGRSALLGVEVGGPGAAPDWLAHIMTRATRFAMLMGCATLIYLVFLVGIVPVPLVPASVADAVLPTVRRRD